MRTLLLILFAELLLASPETFAQDDKPIKDFYLFANNTWLKSVVLPENYVIINQAGIRWKEI